MAMFDFPNRSLADLLVVVLLLVVVGTAGQIVASVPHDAEGTGLHDGARRGVLGRPTGLVDGDRYLAASDETGLFIPPRVLQDLPVLDETDAPFPAPPVETTPEPTVFASNEAPADRSDGVTTEEPVPDDSGPVTDAPFPAPTVETTPEPTVTTEEPAPDDGGPVTDAPFPAPQPVKTTPEPTVFPTNVATTADGSDGVVTEEPTPADEGGAVTDEPTQADEEEDEEDEEDEDDGEEDEDDEDDEDDGEEDEEEDEEDTPDTAAPTPADEQQEEDEEGEDIDEDEEDDDEDTNDDTSRTEPERPAAAPSRPQPPTATATTRQYEDCGRGMPIRNGVLILHGGMYDYDLPRTDHLTAAILDALGDDGPTLADNYNFVFIPSANMEVNEEDVRMMTARWTDPATGIVDPSRFTLLHPLQSDFTRTDVDDAAEADTEAFVAPLRTADVVFFGGGRQYRIIDAYKYTRTVDELWGVLDRGGVVVGTSAGAAALTYFMTRGDPTAGSDVVIAEREWYRYGLGLLRGVALDNHIDARDRFNDMYQVLTLDSELLGIGLSEDTSIVIRDGRYFEVVANVETSVVAVYRCDDNANDDSCNVDASPYIELFPGDWYDLCRRAVLPGGAPPGLGGGGGSSEADGFYDLPYEFSRDHRGEGPDFLCSGRACRFTSSPIRATTASVVVSLTATLTKGNRVFEANLGLDDDYLIIQYRRRTAGDDDDDDDDDADWTTLYDSTSEPDLSVVDLDLELPDVGNGGRSLFQIQILAETLREGDDGQYAVRNLRIDSDE